MASFRKRAGRWQARVNQTNASPLVKTFDAKSDAERWARAIQRDIDLGTYLPRNQAETTTVSQLIERYLLEVVPAFKGAEREKYTLRNLNTLLGSYRLAALTPLVVAVTRNHTHSRNSPNGRMMFVSRTKEIAIEAAVFPAASGN